jgi:hypothetical protein
MIGRSAGSPGMVSHTLKSARADRRGCLCAQEPERHRSGSGSRRRQRPRGDSAHERATTTRNPGLRVFGHAEVHSLTPFDILAIDGQMTHGSLL